MDVNRFSALFAEMEAALDRRSAFAKKMESRGERLRQVAETLDQLRSDRKEIKAALKEKKKFLASIEAAIRVLQPMIVRLNNTERERVERGERIQCRSTLCKDRCVSLDK